MTICLLPSQKVLDGILLIYVQCFFVVHISVFVFSLLFSALTLLVWCHERDSRSTRENANSPNLHKGVISHKVVILLIIWVSHLSSDLLMTAFDHFQIMSTVHMWCAQHGNPRKFASILLVRKLSRRELTYFVGELVHRQFDMTPSWAWTQETCKSLLQWSSKSSTFWGLVSGASESNCEKSQLWRKNRVCVCLYFCSTLSLECFECFLVRCQLIYFLSYALHAVNKL